MADGIICRRGGGKPSYYITTFTVPSSGTYTVTGLPSSVKNAVAYWSSGSTVYTVSYNRLGAAVFIPDADINVKFYRKDSGDFTIDTLNDAISSLSNGVLTYIAASYTSHYFMTGATYKLIVW